jgi:hypothetical protein
MDELDLLLDGLRREAPPADSLARIGPRFWRTIQRRRIAMACAATAATVLCLLGLSVVRQPELPLPAPPALRIPVPDLLISEPALPVLRSRVKPRPQPRAVDAQTIQLASTDPNVVIYWSLQ